MNNSSKKLFFIGLTLSVISFVALFLLMDPIINVGIEVTHLNHFN